MSILRMTRAQSPVAAGHDDRDDDDDDDGKPMEKDYITISLGATHQQRSGREREIGRQCEYNHPTTQCHEDGIIAHI